MTDGGGLLIWFVTDFHPSFIALINVVVRPERRRRTWCHCWSLSSSSVITSCWSRQSYGCLFIHLPLTQKHFLEITSKKGRREKRVSCSSAHSCSFGRQGGPRVLFVDSWHMCSLTSSWKLLLLLLPSRSRERSPRDITHRTNWWAGWRAREEEGSTCDTSAVTPLVPRLYSLFSTTIPPPLLYKKRVCGSHPPECFPHHTWTSTHFRYRGGRGCPPCLCTSEDTSLVTFFLLPLSPLRLHSTTKRPPYGPINWRQGGDTLPTVVIQPLLSRLIADAFAARNAPLAVRSSK